MNHLSRLFIALLEKKNKIISAEVRETNCKQTKLRLNIYVIITMFIAVYIRDIIPKKIINFMIINELLQAYYAYNLIAIYFCMRFNA